MRSIPPTEAALFSRVSDLHACEESRIASLPSTALCLVGLGQLELDAVDAVDTVNKQDQDEDERDLSIVSKTKRQTKDKA